MAGTRQRTPPKPRAGGATAVTTTHPGHAIRGGLSLIAWPAIVFLLLVPLGGPLAYRVADAYGMRVLGLVLAGCFGILAFGVHEHANARMKWLRRQGVWSIGWAAAFLGWVVAFGPDKWWFGLELTTGLVLTVWWTFAKTEPWRGTGQDAHAGEDGAWQRAVGLAESTRPVKVRDEGDERHVDVEHTDNTRDDLTKARQKIEAKGKLPEGSVRVEPVVRAGKILAHASRLVISRTDRLEKIPAWRGPDRPGEGIWVPIRYCNAQDGKPGEWALTPTEDVVGAPSLLSVGTSGGAKTAFQKLILGTAVARRGVVLWASDTRNAPTWAPLFRPALDWFTDDPRETKRMLDGLSAMIPVRAQQVMDATGLDRWTPAAWEEHGIPFLLVWLAEAAPLMGPLEEELKRGNEVWRKAGIKVVAELQRASESNVDTDFRNLIPEAVCFRVMKPVDATMALSEDTIDGGAAPWSITQAEPGVHYAELGNEPSSRWPMRRRTFRPDDPAILRAVATYADRMDWHGLDDASAAAAEAGSKGAYGRRERVSVSTWRSTKYGRIPQLKTAEMNDLIGRAEPRPVSPAPPVQAKAPTTEEDDMTEDEAAPDLALAEYDDDGHEHEDEEIAMEADKVLAAVDAEVNLEEGPDPDDTPLGPLAPALAVLAEPMEGDDDPDLDWTTRPKHPRPSAQQRAVNFQTLAGRLFTDPDLRREDNELRAEVIGQVDGRWAIAPTETMVAIWLTFDGEDVRPALYPRLRAHAKAGNAKQLARGRWAISERALAEPLVIPDDYDPDPPLDPDTEPDEAENEATERDLTDVLQ